MKIRSQRCLLNRLFLGSPALRLAPLLALLLPTAIGCKQSPPVVNVNTVPSGNQASFASAYEIAEGSSLDLVIDPDDPTAVITTTDLPKNAMLQNGIFSFTPDFSQAGLYSITFTITAGTSQLSQTIGIRVLTALHVSPPPITVVNEGATAPDVTFPNNEPAGTIVTYSADVSNAPGATFDPVTAKLSFTPSWKWLDSNPAELSVLVTADATEPDTGKHDTATVKVLYQINEATSFSQELFPLFMLPEGATGTSQSNPSTSPPPELQSSEGHDCVFCHDGSPSAYAGIDFRTPASIYAALFMVPPATTAVGVNGNGAVCYDGAPGAPPGWAPSTSGVMRVAPGDLSKSLWFMKISGTDGAGGPGPPCGVQMPEGFQFFWWTVSDQTKWDACPPTAGDNPCHDQLLCDTTDISCKLSSRYVRKAALWIMAGAPQN